MSCFESNISAITDYFKSGIKQPGAPGRLGVELENIVVDENSNAVSYEGDLGIATLLKELAEEEDEPIYGEGGTLLGLQRPGASITLEPAAQLELSAGPYLEVGLIRNDFEDFHRRLSKILEVRGQRFVTVGYQPRSKADQLALIPKGRYRMMDEHFQAIGPYGRYMMRGSASTQISIDYFSVEDCLRKMRLASAASPLFGLLCDNAPMFEGAPSPHAMMRTEIWRECDPARCGLVKGVLNKDFTLEEYAAYILETPAVFINDENGHYELTDKSFNEVYGDRLMDKEDIELALSLMFNDVRLKTYIEIRTADAMPAPFVGAYAALIKGLFYNEDSLAAMDDLFGEATEEAVKEGKLDLMNRGYDAELYGAPVAQTLNALFDIAYSALHKNEKAFLTPLRSLAASKKTLAILGRKS